MNNAASFMNEERSRQTHCLVTSGESSDVGTEAEDSARLARREEDAGRTQRPMNNVAILVKDELSCQLHRSRH